MPALYALAQHDALLEAAAELGAACVRLVGHLDHRSVAHGHTNHCIAYRRRCRANHGLADRRDTSPTVTAAAIATVAVTATATAVAIAAVAVTAVAVATTADRNAACRAR